jgi:acetyl esterase/lipase
MPNEPMNYVPPSFYAPGFRETHRPRGVVAHEALSYSAIEGYRELQLDVYVPENSNGPVPCVIFIHGGAWFIGTRSWPPLAWPAGQLWQSIVDAGFAVASIDYRHSREASFPAQLHDGFAAIRYLRRFAGELGIDPARFAVWGESAGGHLAGLLALVADPELIGTDGVGEGDTSIQAVVDYYGVSDVRTMPSFFDAFPPHILAQLQASGELADAPFDVLFSRSPYPREEAERLGSPVAHVTAGAPPFLLIHGEEDGAVPIAQSEQLHAALQAAGASSEFVRVPGADHVFLGTDPAPQFEKAIAFLTERLG